jgi:hypothetical protein
MPLDALNRISFAKPTIKVEDILNALEHEKADGREPEITPHQKQIFETNERGSGRHRHAGALVDILSERRNNLKFMNRFVLFVTGHRFIPLSSFRISIEFTRTHDPIDDETPPERMSDEALPTSHSCTNTLTLPWKAYNGSRQLLERKLDQALELSGNDFNMK